MAGWCKEDEWKQNANVVERIDYFIYLFIIFMISTPFPLATYHKGALDFLQQLWPKRAHRRLK